MARTNRYVRKSASGGRWEVIKEGHRRATAHAKTKDEAIRAATSLTRKEGGGEIRVMNRSGKIVEANTVSSAARRRRSRTPRAA